MTLEPSLSPESIRKPSRIACDYSDSPQGCVQVTDRDSRGVNLERIPGFLRKYRSILSKTTRRENYMFLAALLLDNDLPMNASPVRHLTGRWNGKDRRDSLQSVAWDVTADVRINAARIGRRSS